MLAKFNELDKNGDGYLDFKELEALLKKGNPSFTTAEVRQLYDQCDTNHDGKVEFKEFLAYIHRQEHTSDLTSAALENSKSNTMLVMEDATVQDLCKYKKHIRRMFEKSYTC